MESELIPEALGDKFNSLEFVDFVSFLRQKIKENPSVQFSIIANWVDIQKTRSAKALLDQYGSKLHIDSMTIRATSQQYEEDVNAFQSGVKWEEIFDVAYFLAKLSEVERNRVVEIAKFREKLFSTKLESFDNATDQEKYTAIMVEGLSEGDLTCLCRNADKVRLFGLHDLRGILQWVWFLTEDSRFSNKEPLIPKEKS